MGVLVNYSITISADDLAVIGSALDALPHGQVAPVVARIQRQITQQDVAAKAAADAAEAASRFEAAPPSAPARQRRKHS